MYFRNYFSLRRIRFDEKEKIQYASTTIFGAEVMVYCAAYIFRQQQRRMDMSAVTAGFILDYNYYHKSAVLWISVPV